MTYSSTYGNGNYAGATSFSTTALSELGTPNLIDSVLATATKSGYNYQGIRVASTTSAPAQFAFSAVPTTTSGVTQTGSRRFGVATEGVIMADTTLSQHASLASVTGGSPLSN